MCSLHYLTTPMYPRVWPLEGGPIIYPGQIPKLECVFTERELLNPDFGMFEIQLRCLYLKKEWKNAFGFVSITRNKK